MRWEARSDSGEEAGGDGVEDDGVVIVECGVGGGSGGGDWWWRVSEKEQEARAGVNEVWGSRTRRMKV